jgi:branched-chain amino acid transport system substrate-binding protein
MKECKKLFSSYTQWIVHVVRGRLGVGNTARSTLRRVYPLPGVFLLFLLLLVFLIPGCSERKGKREISASIGLIVTNTPDNQGNHRIMEEVGRLAVEEANKRFKDGWGEGKITFHLEVEDDKNQQDLAIRGVRNLITKKNVIALVGPQFSSNAIPAGRVAEKARVPLISPLSTNPETTRGKDFVFRSVFVDTAQGRVMAEFATDTLGFSTAGLLYDISNEYNRGLARMFEEAFIRAGGKGIVEETYTADSREDFSGPLSAIKEAAPELLYLPNYANDVLKQVLQARELGVASVLLGGDGWNLDTFSAIPQFEGAYVTHHWSEEMEGEKTEEFVEAYRKRFGEDPSDLAATTYDAFGVLFEAIASVTSLDPEEIARGLRTSTYRGVTGTLSFQGTGDPKKGVVISKCEDGNFVFQKIMYPY